MNADELLARLRDRSEGAATDRLAVLALEHALDQRLGHWIDPPRLARAVKDGLAAWSATPGGDALLLEGLERWRRDAAQDARKLSEALPAELTDGLSVLVRRPFTPDRALVLAVLDREPVRELVRGLLVDALLEFGKQLRAPVAGVARGLSGLAKMAADTAKSATGSFGAFAGGVVGAVSGEVERQFERRATEFVDSALSGLMKRLVDQLSDPRQAQEQGALRVEVVEGILGLKISQLARDLERRNLPEMLELVRETVQRWTLRADAEEQLTKLVEKHLARPDAPTVREALTRLGLLELARAQLRELARAEAGAFFDTEAFAGWLKELTAAP